jgi:nucleoside 2-deoxyribosyltransferase
MYIVGGSYLEQIHKPYWKELYGSGIRAASAIASLSNRVVLQTYLSKGEVAVAKAKAGALGFTLQVVARELPISFKYFHSLSRPEITPHPAMIRREVSIHIETDDCILRFGFMEGDAIVKGHTVVYDPQSAFKPEEFAANGSSADRLALVLNSGEAKALSGKACVEDAGPVLAERNKADVVVIKRGPFGCTVFAAGRISPVPAFRTKRTNLIGSGDVFAAVFAHFWGEEKHDASEAAEKASRAAAFASVYQQMPLPKDYETQEEFKPVAGSLNGKKVYLAGPFFTMPQLWLIEEGLHAFRNAGIDVFSPYHDVGMGSANDIYMPDISGIQESCILLAYLDGLDPGTLYEIGYAKALGKPVVVFVQNEAEGDLKMIAGAGCIICDDFATAIYHTIWVAMGL